MLYNNIVLYIIYSYTNLASILQNHLVGQLFERGITHADIERIFKQVKLVRAFKMTNTSI